LQGDQSIAEIGGSFRARWIHRIAGRPFVGPVLSWMSSCRGCRPCRHVVEPTAGQGAKVRRLPVIDGQDLVSVVSQADVARNLPEDKVGDLVEAISN
jgi:CBS domain-containing protein